VSPTDPAAFVGAAALLVMVAFAATYLPARRAASVNPMSVLKNE
jgi:ABC-type lipoprotein release transport system permease subunit